MKLLANAVGESAGNLAWGSGEGQRRVRQAGAPRADRRRRHRLAVAVLALAASALACGPRPAKPPPTAVEAAAHRAYRQLTESLGIDAGAVRGRTIVLDPGHGGGYRGATGVRGAAEADVNLAVALFLWGLLADAGADVHLTRTTDRDFLGGELRPPAIHALPSERPGGAGTGAGDRGRAAESALPADSALAPAESLRADLAARTARANSLSPDLFLSIHHNADASGDTTRNQTLTFYRLGDAGPSLDAAQAIHRHLMRNLATATGQVLPGNYHVLRNSNAGAAVLGEPSFLTNPIFEEKLVRIDRVELEATAYFLGIVDYFARGTALVAALSPADDEIDAANVELRAAFTGSPIDPGTVEFLLDGAVLPASRSPAPAGDRDPTVDAYTAAPPGPLANGRHRLLVRARCVGGNAVPPASAFFEIRRPPAEIRAEPWPPWNGGERPGPLGLKMTIRDRLGLAVADSTPIELLAPRPARTFTRRGEAWFQIEEAAAPGGAWRVRSGRAEATTAVVTPGAPAAWSGRVRDALSGRPIPGAELRDGEGGPLLGWSSPEGGFAVRAPSRELAIAAPGYLLELLVGRAAEPQLSPVLGGALHERIIVVDAAGGGSEPLFVSATGARASDAALDLARRLAAELGRAGARAELTRSDDRTLPDLARVEAAERAGAEIVVRLGAEREARVRHHPGSDRGLKLAAAIAREVEAEVALHLPVRAEVTPVLYQTSMPAVELLLAAPADPATEELHLDPDFRRRLTRALLLALGADHGLELGTQGVAVVSTTAPRVLLDGATVIPAGGRPLLVRALEPLPARHRLAALPPSDPSGKAIVFSVGPGDTVRVAIP